MKQGKSERKENKHAFNRKLALVGIIPNQILFPSAFLNNALTCLGVERQEKKESLWACSTKGFAAGNWSSIFKKKILGKADCKFCPPIVPRKVLLQLQRLAHYLLANIGAWSV